MSESGLPSVGGRPFSSAVIEAIYGGGYPPDPSDSVDAVLALFEAAVPRIKAEAIRGVVAELADTSQQEGFDHQLLRAYVERLDRRANRMALGGPA